MVSGDAKSYAMLMHFPELASPAVGTQTYARGQRSFSTYILPATFLGGFGIHNFSARHTGRGIVQLLITCPFIGWFVRAVWAFVECGGSHNALIAACLLRSGQCQPDEEARLPHPALASRLG